MNAEQLSHIAVLGSVIVSWVALALALFCMRRQRQQAELTRKLCERLEHDLKLTNSGSIGMGKRLVAMEKNLQDVRIAPVQAQAGSAPAPVAGKHSLVDAQYTDAARLFGAGVSVDEVARRCGLSRAEASLIQLMQAQVSAA